MTGDILAIRVSNGSPGNGWIAEVDIENLAVGGTYDFGLGTNNADLANAKFKLTVTSNGYDTSGNATTLVRTVYGIPDVNLGAVRQAYPNQASPRESVVSTTLSIMIALSDFIYSSDTVTATVLSGFYTKTGTPNNAISGLSVTNNSTLAYPKSVGRWAWAPYERVTGDFFIEAVVFNRFARNGKPLAAVKFTCTDEHSHSVTYTVNDMTVSTRDSASTNKVLVYAVTVDVSTLTQGDVITCQFVAYPWVGDSGSLLDSTVGADGVADPDERLTPFKVLLDKDSALGTFAVVDVTNGATWSSGHANVGTVQATIESDYAGDNTKSWKTIGDASKAIKDYNNTHLSHNDPGAGTILLTADSTLDWPKVAFATVASSTKTWLIIKPLTGVARANIILTQNSLASAIPANLKVKVEGITIQNATTSVMKGSTTATQLWFHNNILNYTGAVCGYQVKFQYATNNSVTAFGGSFRGYSTEYMAWPLIRGNAINDGVFINSQPYAVLGNKNLRISSYNLLTIHAPDNSIFGFNSIYGYTDTSAFILYIDLADTIGIAFVQNLIERKSGVQGNLGVYPDGCKTASENLILWHNLSIGNRVNVGYNDDGGTNWDTWVLHKNWSMAGNLFEEFNNKDDTFTDTSAAIGGITKANPGVITLTGTVTGTFANGKRVFLTGITGMTELNGTTQTIANWNAGAKTFEIADTSAMTTYSSGGLATSSNPARVGAWPVGYHIGSVGQYQNTSDGGGEWFGEALGLSAIPSGSGTFTFVHDYSARTGSGAGNGDYHLASDNSARDRILSGYAVLPFDLEGAVRRNDGTGAAGPYEYPGALTKALDDTITLSEAIFISYGLSKADTITLSEALAKVFGTSKSDTITLSDAIAKAIKPVKADVITLSEAIAKNVGLSKSDTATLSDAIGKMLRVSKADTITLSDSISAIITLILSLGDTLTLSDGMAKIPGLSKADTLNLSDALAKTIGIPKADTITLSDSLTAIITLILALADTLTLSDSTKRSAGMSRTDTVTLSDTAAKKPLIARSDTVTLSDIIAKVAGLARADTVTMSDVIAKAASLSRDDLVALTDALTKSVRLSEADIIALSDVIVFTMGALRLDLSDTVTLSDLIEVIKLALEFVDTAAARQFLDTIPSRNFTDQGAGKGVYR